MFVDASAIVAMIAGEAEAGAMTDAVAHARSAVTSPLSTYEASMALARKKAAKGQALEVVKLFLQASRIGVEPITAAHAALALEAHARFGKGTGHPAQLNMGDCFSYALAKSLGLSLLFKGKDFIHTDIPQALR
jgi:ribonuclease VapC